MPYTLAPPPYQTVLDNAGHIVPNACIWTYVAGTTTPALTYSDPIGTPNTNPIRADAAGRYTAYLSPGAGYLFVFEQPATPPAHGAVIRTQDNVLGAAAAAGVTSGTWLPSLGGTATYTVQEGTWLRVGPLVIAIGRFVVAALGSGSGAIVAGVPFTPTAITPVVLAPFEQLVTPIVSVNAFLVTDKNIYFNNAATPTVTQGQAPIFGAGTTIYLSVTYFTADP